MRRATLELASERIPVVWDGDDSTDELIAMLSRPRHAEDARDRW